MTAPEINFGACLSWLLWDTVESGWAEDWEARDLLQVTCGSVPCRNIRRQLRGRPRGWRQQEGGGKDSLQGSLETNPRMRQGQEAQSQEREQAVLAGGGGSGGKGWRLSDWWPPRKGSWKNEQLLVSREEERSFWADRAQWMGNLKGLRRWLLPGYARPAAGVLQCPFPISGAASS